MNSSLSICIVVLLIGYTAGFHNFACKSFKLNKLTSPSQRKINSLLYISMSLPDLDLGSSLPSTLISASSLADRMGILPLCLKASSKSTTFDDPTAGMTPEEITDYVSNVGGGLCGAPEFVKSGVGLGLNLSLILFGLLTVSYAITGGLKFALEKQVEDSIKSADIAALRPPGQPSLEEMANVAGLKMTGSGPGLQQTMMSAEERERNERLLNGDISAGMELKNTALTQASSRAEFEDTMGKPNREARRLEKKFKDNK